MSLHVMNVYAGRCSMCEHHHKENTALRAEVQALKQELLETLIDRNEWMNETCCGPESEDRIEQLQAELEDEP